MKRIFKILLIVLVLLFGTVLAAPFLFKGKIVDLIKTEANNTLNAKLDFSEDIGISLISNFPDFTLSLNEFSIVGVEDFEGDTLVYLKEFTATLDFMSVVNGDKIEIKTIELINPIVNALVLEDGKANWDITKPSETEEATEEDTATSDAFKIGLQKLLIEDGAIVFDDQSLGFNTELKGLNLNLSGDFTQDLFTLVTQASIAAFTLGYDGVNYLNKVNTQLDIQMDMDMPNFKFTFKENSLKLNELELAVDGYFAMPTEDMEMDLTMKALKTDFRNILSLVPAVYTADFKEVKTSGKMALDAMVKGVFSEEKMPAFDIKLLVEQGQFSYPDMPASVDNVGVDLKVTNPNGELDATVVDLSVLSFSMADAPFTASLLLKQPMSDPYLDTRLDGSINLENVSKVVPLEEGMQLSGNINSNLSAKGFMSTIEKEQYDQFDAKGNIIVNGLKYVSKDMPEGFKLNTTSLNFSPQEVVLNAFDAQMGPSDFKMNGSLRNFFPYMTGAGVLKGQLDFQSNVIDANWFLSEETAETDTEPSPEDTIPLEVIPIPGDIDFVMNTSIGKLYYDNLEITDMKGTVKVVDSSLVFENVALNVLDGNITMDGAYSTKNPKQPLVDMQFGVQDIDIQQSAAYFNTIEQLAPVAKYTQGKASLDFNMNTLLNNDMTPLMPSLTAFGQMDLASASLSGFKPLDKVADVLKSPKYKELNVGQTKVKFTVEDGRVNVEPFDVKSGNLNMNVAGSSGIDQTLDYDLKVTIPRSELGIVDNAVSGALAQVESKGLKLNSSETVKVNLKLGGTIDKPTIKTDFKEQKKETADQVKDQVKQAIDDKKKELEDKAKQEADRLKKEAEEKARKEQERLKKEAEEKARKEKERLKKEAEEKAKKKLKGILKP